MSRRLLIILSSFLYFVYFINSPYILFPLFFVRLNNERLIKIISRSSASSNSDIKLVYQYISRHELSSITRTLIVGSNPIQDMDVLCVCAFFCVCVTLYLGRDLATGRSLVQGDLDIVIVQYKRNGYKKICISTYQDMISLRSLEHCSHGFESHSKAWVPVCAFILCLCCSVCR
jgi:hypothetical protein